MPRLLIRAAGLYVLSGLIGLLLERMGLSRCHCAPNCWCQRPVLNAFRWVLPWGHRN